MKKNSLIILLFINLIYGQEQTQTTGKIKVYTPTNSSSKVKKVADTYKWTVKTDLFAYVGSEFPVIFEYKVTPKLSVEGSAGVTYSLYEGNTLFKNSRDIKNGTSIADKSAMGSAFRGGIKYYPSSDYDAIEGWSFGIQIFTKTLNRETVQNSSDQVNVAGLKNSYNKTGVEITIAKQLFSDSNITFESLFGIGIASITDNYNYINSYFNNNQYVYELKTETIKSTSPNIHLGLRIGFGN